MNRIIIVGHPSSNYQEVSSVLQQCGMCEALPSRREGLLPQEITSTLCRIYQRPQIDCITVENDIEQLQVAPVWHGMALDLMLGNLDQKLWGWADPQAIYTLDYWKQLDDKLTFVLVYDEPQLALLQTPIQQRNISTPELEQRLSNWMAYNSALLRFFLRNTERCLLVNSQQVQRNSADYLQKLQPLLNAQHLSLPDTATDLADRTSSNVNSINILIPEKKLTNIADLAGLETDEAKETLLGSSVERYLLDQLMTEYPAYLQLYSELQSAASLPHKTISLEVASPIKAWEALVCQRKLAIELASRLYDAYQGICLSLEEKSAEQRQLREQSVRLQSVDEENNLLLSQLHQVQNELERCYLEKESEKSDLEKALTEVQTKLKAVHSAEQQKLHEQSVQLQTVGEENNLLLSQLHHAQSELERYYLENKNLKAQLPIPLYGAAQRVKGELSYRLGAVMIQRAYSLKGWLGMPWALFAERRAWYLHNSAQPQEKLPPIDIYSDSYEALRVKRHLSYRLGKSLIRYGKSPIGWIKLPFVLSNEVRQFRAQRKES